MRSGCFRIRGLFQYSGANQQTMLALGDAQGCQICEEVRHPTSAFLSSSRKQDSPAEVSNRQGSATGASGTMPVREESRPRHFQGSRTLWPVRNRERERDKHDQSHWTHDGGKRPNSTDPVLVAEIPRSPEAAQRTPTKVGEVRKSYLGNQNF